MSNKIVIGAKIALEYNTLEDCYIVKIKNGKSIRLDKYSFSKLCCAINDYIDKTGCSDIKKIGY